MQPSPPLARLTFGLLPRGGAGTDHPQGGTSAWNNYKWLPGQAATTAP